RPPARKVAEAIDPGAAYREAVGNEGALCIEIHRQLTPGEAIVLGRGIEPYHPFFYEDPTLPDSFDAMAEIAAKINIPIATGARPHTLCEFEMLLDRAPVPYGRTDAVMCTR